MQKALRIAALIAFVPLLAGCSLALRSYLAVVGFVYSLAGWELAWPPVARVDLEAKGKARHLRSRRR
jgi:outer membrane lipopolysaccharide assembly protein LptE/RlpB